MLMVESRKLSFVTMVNKNELYKENVITSTLDYKNFIEYITVKNSESGSTGLNAGIKKASNDIILCCHQDVHFNKGWYEKLNEYLDKLNDNVKYKTWGVLGFAGSTNDGVSVGTHSGLGMLYNSNKLEIIPVQTLDESILILKKSDNLKFDEKLIYFHMYGTDIALQSHNKNLGVYVINVSIEHRTKWTAGKGLGESENYIKKKWINKLLNKYNSIHTTVGIIESNEEFSRRTNENSDIMRWKRNSLRCG